MIDERVLRYLLRRLLDAQEHRGGRFIEADAIDALKYVGAYGADWRERMQWLRDEGYVVQHTTLQDALSEHGVSIAGTA